MLNSFASASRSSLTSRCGMSRASHMLCMCCPKMGSDGPKTACTPNLTCWQADKQIFSLHNLFRKSSCYVKVNWCDLKSCSGYGFIYATVAFLLWETPYWVASSGKMAGGGTLSRYNINNLSPITYITLYELFDCVDHWYTGATLLDNPVVGTHYIVSCDAEVCGVERESSRMIQGRMHWAVCFTRCVSLVVRPVAKTLPTPWCCLPHHFHGCRRVWQPCINVCTTYVRRELHKLTK